MAEKQSLTMMRSGVPEWADSDCHVSEGSRKVELRIKHRDSRRTVVGGGQMSGRGPFAKPAVFQRTDFFSDECNLAEGSQSAGLAKSAKCGLVMVQRKETVISSIVYLVGVVVRF